MSQVTYLFENGYMFDMICRYLLSFDTANHLSDSELLVKNVYTFIYIIFVFI